MPKGLDEPERGRLQVQEALRLTKWAAKEGADASLMVAPYYNKPTQEGFYQHFKAVAELVGIPICVHNIPGRIGKNIEPNPIPLKAAMKMLGRSAVVARSPDRATISTAGLLVASPKCHQKETFGRLFRRGPPTRAEPHSR